MIINLAYFWDEGYMCKEIGVSALFSILSNKMSLVCVSFAAKESLQLNNAKNDCRKKIYSTLVYRRRKRQVKGEIEEKEKKKNNKVKRRRRKQRQGEEEDQNENNKIRRKETEKEEQEKKKYRK